MVPPTLTSNWTHPTRRGDRRYAGAGEDALEGGERGVLILVRARVIAVELEEDTEKKGRRMERRKNRVGGSCRV